MKPVTTGPSWKNIKDCLDEINRLRAVLKRIDDSYSHSCNAGNWAREVLAPQRES